MKRTDIARTVAYTGIFAAIMVISQVVMAGLPNIELVSLLVIVYTIYDSRLAKASIAVFVLVQGLLYGFHMWWVAYLYVWYVLHFVILATKKHASPLFCAVVSGFFGLAFGTMSALPYFLSGGLGGGLSYIIAGIPFDILHCIGNFFLALFLFKPLCFVFGKLPKSHI